VSAKVFHGGQRRNFAYTFQVADDAMKLNFAADESRWIRSPSSALIIHEKLGAKISYAKRFI